MRRSIHNTPRWLRIGLGLTYTILALELGALGMLRNENKRVDEQMAISTTESRHTEMPKQTASPLITATETLMPTATHFLPPVQDLRGDELIWEGKNDQIIDHQIPLQAISARAVFTPPDLFEVDIYFTDVPEYLELNEDILGDSPDEADPRFDYQELAWGVYIDVNGDNLPDGTGEEYRKYVLDDLDLFITQNRKFRETINFSDYSDWSAASIGLPERSVKDLLRYDHWSLEYEFDPEENKLKMRANINEIELINEKSIIRVNSFYKKSWSQDFWYDFELLLQKQDRQNAKSFSTATDYIKENNFDCYQKIDLVEEYPPDHIDLNRNRQFTKKWTLQNSGTCIWKTDYQLIWLRGERLSDELVIPLEKVVMPGDKYTFSVDMKAPSKPKSSPFLSSRWSFVDSSGKEIYILYAKIHVD